MVVTTTWAKEQFPGGRSIWSSDIFPWQLALPWQYGKSATVWTKEY